MNKKLEKKIDIVFSKYIKALKTKDGYGNCVSCGALKPVEELDAGHFINRRWRSVRWEEDNVWPQCRSCNRFSEGNISGYTLFLLDKLGRERLDYLQAISRTTARFTDSEGELMLSDFKRKLDKLN